MDALDGADSNGDNGLKNIKIQNVTTVTSLNGDDPFVSCQVNISIVKTLTEESSEKLYRSTVNKEYVACRPLSAIQKTNPTQENVKPANENQSSVAHETSEFEEIEVKPFASNYQDNNYFQYNDAFSQKSTSISGYNNSRILNISNVKDAPHTGSETTSGTEFCIVNAVSLSNPVSIKEEPVDEDLYAYNSADNTNYTINENENVIKSGQGYEISEFPSQEGRSIIYGESNKSFGGIYGEQSGNCEFSITGVISLKNEGGNEEPCHSSINIPSSNKSFNRIGAALESGAKVESDEQADRDIFQSNINPQVEDIVKSDVDTQVDDIQTDDNTQAEYKTCNGEVNINETLSKVSAVTPSSFVLDHQQYNASDRLKIKKMLADIKNLRIKQSSTKVKTEDQSCMCTFCGKSFTRKWNMKKHRKTCGHLRCLTCNMLFSRRCYLDKHTETHCITPGNNVTVDSNFGNEEDIKPGCSRTSSNETTLVGRGDIQSFPRRFHCKKCGRSFSYLNSLKNHLNNHDTYKHKCSICNQVYAKAAHLEKHKGLDHAVPTDISNAVVREENESKLLFSEVESENVDGICSKETSTLPYKSENVLEESLFIKEDNNTCSKKIKKYACNHCGKIFYNQANLIMHEKVHSFPKTFHCNKCGRSFIKAESLKNHLNNHDSYKHKCNICNHVFSKAAHLEKHKGVEHNIVSAGNHISNVKIKKEKESNILGMGNGERSGISTNMNREGKVEVRRKENKSLLKSQSHIIDLNAKGKYACKQCNRSYTDEATLLDHEKLHALSKRFHCEKCGRSFFRMESLRKHLSNHDTYKHNCSICYQIFSRGADLQRHKELDHAAPIDTLTSNIEMEEANENKSFLSDIGNGNIDNINKERDSLPCDSSTVANTSSVKKECNDTDIKKNKQVACKYCSRTYAKRAFLIKHEKLHENNTYFPKRFNCEKCGRSFVNQDNLKNHIINHDTYKHNCSICYQVYSRGADLQRHKELDHAAPIDTLTSNIEMDDANENKLNLSEIGSGDIDGISNETNSLLCKSTNTSLLKMEYKDTDIIGKCKQFTCKFCSRTFAKRGNLVNHEKLHSVPKTLHCKKCGRLFVSPTALKKHLSNHDTYKHNCHVCMQVFARAADMEKHKEKDHIVLPADNHTSNLETREANESKISLSETGNGNVDDISSKEKTSLNYKKTGKSSSLKLEYNDTGKYENKQFGCKHCGRTYTKEAKLVAHEKLHSNPKIFHCEKCGNIFHYKQSLQRHLSEHDLLKHQCHICNRIFTRAAFLQKHIEVNHNVSTDKLEMKSDLEQSKQVDSILHRVHLPANTFKCDICKKVFLHMYSLKRHLHKHEVYNHHCSSCGLVFARASSLQNHKQVCQSAPSADNISLEDKVANEGAVMSGLLDAGDVISEANKNKLKKSKMHRNTSLKQRYPCKQCLKTYSTQDNLIAHEKLHSSFQGFPCEKCGRIFLHFKSLKVHLDKHETYKHRCSVCGMIFARAGHLVKHKELNHNLSIDTSVPVEKGTSGHALSGGIENGSISANTSQVHMKTNTLPSKLEIGYFIKYEKYPNIENDGADLASLPDTGGTTEKVNKELNKSKKSKVYPKRRRYTCKQCLKTYSKEANLIAHEKSHTGSQGFLCEKCGRIFIHFKSLKVHLDNHESYKHRCSVCGKIFARAKYLVKHKELNHNVSIDNSAPFVKGSGGNASGGIENGVLSGSTSQVFENSNTVQAKLEKEPLKDNNDSDLKVEHKDRKDTYDNTFEPEESSSGDFTYECIQCDRVFTSKRSLGAHRIVHSPGKRRFKITLKTNIRSAIHEKLSKKYQQSKIAIGMTNREGKEINSDLSDLPESDESLAKEDLQLINNDAHSSQRGKEVGLEKMKEGEDDDSCSFFKCAKCDTSFSLAKDLDRHNKMHDDASYKYKCQTCSMSFCRQLHLTNHHKNAKKCQCLKCSRFFCHSRILNMHQKTCNPGIDNEMSANDHCVSEEHGLLGDHSNGTCNTTNSANKDSLLNSNNANLSSIEGSLQDSDSMQKDLELAYLFSEDSSYECMQCARVFASERSLEDHRIVHSGERHFSSAWSTFTSKGNNRLEMHKKRTKKYQPEKSDEYFSSITNIKDTPNKTHDDGTRLDQHALSESLINESSFEKEKHLALGIDSKQLSIDAINHEEGMNSDLSVLPGNEREVKGEYSKGYFKCDTCEKVLPSAKDLYGHKRFHYDAKHNYKCTTCSMNFQKQNHFTNHRRTAKKRQCSNCSRYFCHAITLNQHKKECKHVLPSGGCDKPSDVNTSVSKGLMSNDAELFPKEASLQENISANTLKPGQISSLDSSYECLQCDRVFLSKRSLGAHCIVHSRKRQISSAWSTIALKRNAKLQQQQKRSKKNQHGKSDDGSADLKDNRIKSKSDGNNSDEHALPGKIINEISFKKKKCLPPYLGDSKQPSIDPITLYTDADQEVELSQNTIGLEDAQEKEDAPGGYFNCDKCDMIFPSAGHLNTHKKIHKNQCATCKMNFQRKFHLAHHQTNAKKLPCSYCPRYFCHMISLNRHMKECNHGLDNATAANDHNLSKKDIDELPSGCCDKTSDISASKDLMPNGIDVIHKEASLNMSDNNTLQVENILGDSCYQCKQCDRMFRSKRSLGAHCIIHSRKIPFSSAKSTIILKRNIRLAIHEKRSKKRQYIKRNKDFWGTVNLKDKIKSKSSELHDGLTDSNQQFTEDTENTTSPEVVPDVPESDSFGKPLWKCTLCKKVFVSKMTLVSHRTIHTGERPFSCTWCKQTFRRSDTLAKHKQPALQLTCQVCGKQICNKLFLKRHMRRCHQDAGGKNDVLSADMIGVNKELELTSAGSPSGKSDSEKDQGLHSDEIGKNDVLSTNTAGSEKGEELHVAVPIGTDDALSASITSTEAEQDQELASSEDIPYDSTPPSVDVDGQNNISKENNYFGRGNHWRKKGRPRQRYQCLQCTKSFLAKRSLIAHRLFHFKQGRIDSNLRKNKVTMNPQLQGLPKEVIIKKNASCADENESTKKDELNQSIIYFTDESSQKCVTWTKRSEEGEKDEEEGIDKNTDKLAHQKCNDDLIEGTDRVAKKRYKLHKCNICNKTLSTVRTLQRHIKLSHAVQSDLNANDGSSKSFQKLSKPAVQTPFHQKNDYSFICENCGQKFKTNYHLSKHLNKLIPCYTSESTNKRKRRSSLTSHDGTIEHHDQEGIHKCDICNKLYSSKYNLLKHAKVVHSTVEKAYKCEICDKCFMYASALGLHQAVHQTERPFVCNICGSAFKMMPSLKYHSARKHKISLETCSDNDSNSDTVLSKNSNLKPYKCGCCSKTFMYAMDLKRHKEIHNGEAMSTLVSPGLRYSCDKCSKKFGLRTAFVNHRRKHIARDLGIFLPRNCTVFVEPLVDSCIIYNS